jgi:hypothetical protein
MSLLARTTVLAMAMLIALGGAVRAQDDARPLGDKAVEAGGKGLRRAANFPWYDPAQDDLRDMHARERADADTDTRKTGWEVDAPQPKPRGTPTSWQFPTLAMIVQYTAMALFVVLIVGLVILLIRYFLKDDEEGAAGGRSGEIELEDRTSDVDRVEQLPFQVRRPDANLLSEARRLYEAGRFDDAIVYLYSYQLVELDKHQLIHLAKGKTNRQYLRELRGTETLPEILHESMIAFEDVFFGRHSLGRKRFERCWEQLDSFHGALRQGVAA